MMNMVFVLIFYYVRFSKKHILLFADVATMQTRDKMVALKL